jgi:toxin ParE1/3/4
LVTALAERDTGDILEPLSIEAGAGVAECCAAEFGRFFTRLEHFPKSDPRRSRLGRHVRVGVIAPYIVFYEYAETDDLVSILRILHGHRRVGRSHMR